MAQVKQIGPGRKTSGTIDGITYVTRNGKTYVRSTPTMPISAYRTPAALKRQAIFKLIQLHMRYHLRTIRQTITPKGNGSPSNRYLSLNYKALSKALDGLAAQLVAGDDITITDVEAAISAYATEHPTSIRIASLSGYQEVYLTGAWPDTITISALSNANTVIVIVSENGTTTTIEADGRTTVVSGSGSGNQNENENQNGGSSTGSDTTGTPVLTISKSGSGTATVSAGGNEVNSGAELAANTEVTVTVTPAAGKVPTATVGGNTVTLTEDSGTYTGTFNMSNDNATLVINTGTSGDNGDTN
jgi:hypothetical protein